MLLELYWFSSFALLDPAPPLLSGNAPIIVHTGGSCIGSSIGSVLLHFLYWTFHPTCSHIFPSPLQSGKPHQPGPLATFNILSLSLTFGLLLMMCLAVGLFAYILFGTLCASWTCMSVSFTKLGSFLSLFFQIDFQFLALGLLLVPPWRKCWTY